MFLALFALAVLSETAAPAVEWKALEPGLELGTFQARHPSPVGDSRITVLRIDPARWELRVAARSASGEKAGRTARQWARANGLVAAINAGMFATDHVTHVGYMASAGHVNSGAANRYESVAAFDPKDGAAPPFRIFDLDVEGVTLASIRAQYESVIQNLRLIKKPGENRWAQQSRRWSEAALGEDRDGKVLFVFCRSPFSMHDLNEELLSADFGLVALQHLEGGPEAQLFFDAGGVELERFGSYETLFQEDDGNGSPWPIPNVLGIRRRPEAK